MRVALLQFAADIDAAKNRQAITELLSQIDPGTQDLVVLPEAVQHDFGPADLDLRKVAESREGPFATLLAEEARRLETTIIAGMFEATDDLPYNTLLVIGPDGQERAAYRKIHLYDSFGHRESDRFRAGDLTPTLVELGNRTLGLLTCYDLRFPELARALVSAGADVLVVPAAWVAGKHKVDHWRTLLQARAIENVCQVIAPGQSGRRYTGHSLIADPWGTIVVEASEESQILTAELRLEEVHSARDTNPSLSNRRMLLP